MDDDPPDSQPQVLVELGQSVVVLGILEVGSISTGRFLPKGLQKWMSSITYAWKRHTLNMLLLTD